MWAEGTESRHEHFPLDSLYRDLNNPWRRLEADVRNFPVGLRRQDAGDFAGVAAQKASHGAAADSRPNSIHASVSPFEYTNVS